MPNTNSGSGDWSQAMPGSSDTPSTDQEIIAAEVVEQITGQKPWDTFADKGGSGTISYEKPSNEFKSRGEQVREACEGRGSPENRSVMD